MTVYVSTMILRSMRMTGEKIRGATLTSNEQTETLYELNSFMDACALERLLCYTVKQDSLALTQGVSSYTIGSGGAFNVTRPTKIVDPCFVRDANNYDSRVEVVGADAYGKIKVKNVGNTYPQALYYNADYGATGLGTIFLYPVPIGGLTLFINSWSQIGTFSSQSQALSLPPGYQLFIESNFAIHLAAGYTNVSPELAKIAKESKAAIKGVNIPDTVARLDYGVLTGYRGSRSSILTGP